MDSGVSKFLKNNKENKKIEKKNFLISFFNKILICFILVITCLIFMKSNSSFKDFIEEEVYHNNLSFAYINNLYTKYFGEILPSINTNITTPVFNEKLEYKSYNTYYDGYKLEVSERYLVPIIESGIVVFMGDIENYGYTVIIEGIDGVDIWYSNIKNESVKLYDYVEKGSYLGEVIENNLYLVFERNQEYLKFDEYLKN